MKSPSLVFLPRCMAKALTLAFLARPPAGQQALAAGLVSACLMFVVFHVSGAGREALEGAALTVARVSILLAVAAGLMWTWLRRRGGHSRIGGGAR